MTARPDTLFVYGTLLAVAEHPMGQLLRDTSNRIGSGSIQARLYEIDDPDMPGENSYPGALPSPHAGDRVFGDVFRLLEPERVLTAFDAYEACTPDYPEPHEFALRGVRVQMEDGSVQAAWSYLYTWDVSTAVAIPSGRWTRVAPEVK